MSTRMVFTGINNLDEIEVYASHDNTIQIFLHVEDEREQSIVLDVDTAIKFSKELRREIAYIKQQEVING